MSVDYRLGRIGWHRPTRGVRGDDRPQGAYLTLFMGKHSTAKHIRLSVDDLLRLSQEATATAQRLLSEGEDPA